MRARLILLIALLLGAPASVLSQTIEFAVIGDSGTGGGHQKEVASQMVAFHQNHPWEFILMLGDNIYENGDPDDFDEKFKNIYKKLNVPFHATLGNHDRSTEEFARKQVQDPAFGYEDRKDEYEFPAGPRIGGKQLARFICLNSGAWRDRDELSRREKDLDGWLSKSSDYHWNFVFFHHPIYSFAHSKWPFGWLSFGWGHGSDKQLRKRWEQTFIDGRIDIVLSGHDHFYQKIKKQKGGIHYFVSGGAGKIRAGIKKNHAEVEFGKVTYHFLHFEVSEEEVRFAAVDKDGNIFHQGCIRKDEEECSAQVQD